MRIIVWGAGKIGRLCRQYIEQITNDEFIGFVDNDYQLGGGKAFRFRKD